MLDGFIENVNVAEVDDEVKIEDVVIEIGRRGVRDDERQDRGDHEHDADRRFVFEKLPNGLADAAREATIATYPGEV